MGLLRLFPEYYSQVCGAAHGEWDLKYFFWPNQGYGVKRRRWLTKWWKRTRRRSQMVYLKPPWWSPRRDDQNRHMDRIFRRPNEEVVLFGISPRLPKPDHPVFPWFPLPRNRRVGFWQNRSEFVDRFWVGFFRFFICIRCPTGVDLHTL